MQGSVILDFGTGWSCSNESNYMIERKLIKNEKGERLSKHTETLRALFYYTPEGIMQVGQEGKAVFKLDGSDTKLGYKVKIVGLTEEMAILEVLAQIEDTQSIIKQIGGYNNGK